ncbi:MAG: DISARM system phospholipase D-like protein DrmC [Polyangiaceae bacterium]|jgi:phosphatidylserine/phosphatidylglycerophosphate/cardiolipin synthase-like enzyme|nr:DISARM system phospholipase D-like protein DrmC [Polyangiaceae bacterium]
MNPRDGGLTTISTQSLQRLRNAVVHDEIPLPVSASGLTALQLGPFAGAVELFAGLDRHATLKVLDAVLAERARPVTAPQLVSTWPDGHGVRGAQTAEVVHDLFSKAMHHILVAGYSFDHGASLLKPLHDAMVDRRTSVELYIHLDPEPGDPTEARELAQAQVSRFLRTQWPWTEKPAVYFDPRTVTPSSSPAQPSHLEYASLHAKCVVVDRRWAFITSANFTDRGQHRNVEVGVLLDDRHFSEKLVGQFQEATRKGVFVDWLAPEKC